MLGSPLSSQALKGLLSAMLTSPPLPRNVSTIEGELREHPVMSASVNALLRVSGAFARFDPPRILNFGKNKDIIYGAPDES